jgi:hypothetical protein
MPAWKRLKRLVSGVKVKSASALFLIYKHRASGHQLSMLGG